MSDTRNHTTRDQLDGTDEFWLCNSSDHVRYSTHDYCLVHETPIPTDDRCPVTVAKLAAVRAAAVAETTAAIEALAAKWERQEYKPGAFYPEASAYADGRDTQAEACADEIREVLSGGRTALDTTLAQAWDQGFQAACDQTSVFHTPEGPTDDLNPYRADEGADQ